MNISLCALILGFSFIWCFFAVGFFKLFDKVVHTTVFEVYIVTCFVSFLCLFLKPIYGVLFIILSPFSFLILLKFLPHFLHFLLPLFFIFCYCILLVLTISIFLFLLFLSVEFFIEYGFLNFFLNTTWNTNESSFGFLAPLWGSAVVLVLSMAISYPFSLFLAIFICEYCNTLFKKFFTILAEILATVPSVVYGFLTVILFASPLQRFMNHVLNFFFHEHINIPIFNVFLGAIGVSLSIIPFMTAFFITSINSIPKSIHEASYALGSFKHEKIFHIVLPYLTPALLTIFFVGFSRIIGETTVILLTMGTDSAFTLDPNESISTITAQIYDLLLSDLSFGSVSFGAAYALGFCLLCISFFTSFLISYLSKRIINKKLLNSV